LPITDGAPKVAVMTILRRYMPLLLEAIPSVLSEPAET
jgi:hypothetical protein